MKTMDCSNCEAREKSVFCQISCELISELDEGKNTNLYKKGQNLFVQGNPPFGLYCINSGKIKISKANSDGGEVILRVAGPGDLVGHRSLFSNTPYLATATVLEEARVCFVGKSMITKIIKESPEVAFSIIQRLSEQMGAAEGKVNSLASRSLRERIAEMLLLLNQSYGEKEEERQKLNIKLTRQEIAAMVGAATENVIRTLSDFKKEGLISQEGKVIFLNDLETLEEISGVDIV